MKKILLVWTVLLLAVAPLYASGGYGGGGHKGSGSKDMAKPGGACAVCAAKKGKGDSKLALAGNCAVCVVEMGSIVPGNSAFVTEYNGQIYLFPSIKQQKMFLDNPGKYAGKGQAEYDKIMENVGY